MSIPVIDIFAGPGGLGEGFSSVFDDNGDRVFRTVLSIEMEKFAHETLELRSFYRQFRPDEVPPEYYQFLRKEKTKAELFTAYGEEYENAKKEAWCARLGDEAGSKSASEVDERIVTALNGNEDWVLLGGPPCQAYSVVGRSRRKEKTLNPDTDHRVELYKQYLRILAVHNPFVFVMENVKGILSAATVKNKIFEKILSDLEEPVKALKEEDAKLYKNLECPGYDIYSVTVEMEDGQKPKPTDFIIRSEQYGIPQARHRVIIVGVRKNAGVKPRVLTPVQEEATVSNMLEGLPQLRSGISRGAESTDSNWLEAIKRSENLPFIKRIDPEVAKEIKRVIRNLEVSPYKIGGGFVKYSEVSIGHPEAKWFIDERIKGVCNHESRAHMQSDLYRYLFVSVYGKVLGKSPTLSDFPEELLPAHKNVQDGINKKKFADRFRVQIEDRPAKTITSHISKDGHYYIHPDPSQCRSLTVREAARIQTFPDNYFFCGPRTNQYIQVGNAVPPLLANKIATIVVGIVKVNDIIGSNDNIKSSNQ